MPKLLATALLSASVLTGAFAAESGDFKPDPRFPNGDQIRELLAEGVKEYHAGRFADAAKSFHDVLLQHPDEKLCYEFYLAAGDGLLVSMEERDELRDVLKDLLRQARIYQKALRHDDKYLGQLIDKLEKSEEERLVATNELVAVGPIAVPLLVARMNDNRQDDMRVYCRIVLTRMGYRSVMPLMEALNAKDERLIASVSAVLADIGDPRPLPKLKQLADSKDTSETTKKVVTNTIAAIGQRNGINEIATADKLYFLEALRYFRGGDLVRDEMVSNESLSWRWDESKEAINQKLSYVRVPRYAWKELVAENLLFAGIQYYPEYTAYQPLLAAVLAAQDVEVNKRVRLAKERTIPVEHPDEASDAIAERVAALSEMSLRVRMFGAAHLLKAVQESIATERYDVAVYIMRLLQDRSLAKPEVNLPVGGLASDKPGTVLVAALDHTDKMVRYQAAITLAYLDPALMFFNADKVVPILSDAVGEWGNRVVLVVDQDYRQRNVAREQLQGKGFRVYAVQDGFEAMQRLEESPIKDAIVIAGDLIPTVRDEHGGIINVDEQKADTLVAKLAKDWRSEKTPVFISLPDNPELAAKIQKAFDGKGNVKGFIQKPFNSVDMAGQIDAAVSKSDLPNANREDAEDISLRAAIALQQPDPSRTQFDLTKATEALVKTLEARSDAIRLQTLVALGHAAQMPKGDMAKAAIGKVTDVYGTQDAQLKPELRAAWLYAIGQLNPTTEPSIAILLKALQFTYAEGDPAVAAAAQLHVRTAAADAVGHAAIPNEVLSKYEVQQRLDVRAQGAGKEDSAAKPAADAAATK
jgi:CheY-like chemotaxis protein